MTLRARIGLAAVALSVAIVAGFGAVVYSVFTRQQERQLRVILEQDLERVTTLLDRPTLGSSFAGPDSSSVILQLVTPAGHVVLAWGDKEPLPATQEPDVLARDDRTYLVATGVWPSTNGSVRLAHDISDALAARRDLVRILVGAAMVVTLVAAVAAVVGARRMLSPLARVAQQARAVDPAAPADVEYQGPNDEIGDLVAALNVALEAIRQRQEAERGFLLEVAHELAAPLTLVNYHLGAVRQEHPDDGRVRAAADGTRELLRTSQDLLVLARGELERGLELRVVDLREIVLRVADEYPGLSVHADERLEVVGDPERLVQVTRNLVRNALQAVGRPDGVEVALRSSGDHAVLQVCDDGPGMSPETAARIFDHGFSAAGGVGVGLTICKRLVEQHQGEIRIRSSLGEGSCFEVWLLSLAARLEGMPTQDAVAKPAGAS